MSRLLRMASFNVTGIRARLPLLVSWLREEALEEVCLQETKVRDNEFPGEALENLEYCCACRGRRDSTASPGGSHLGHGIHGPQVSAVMDRPGASEISEAFGSHAHSGGVRIGLSP